MAQRLLFIFSIYASVVFSSVTEDLPILRPEKSGERSWVLFTAGYRMPVGTGKIINSGHGVYVEAGINPGRFISKQTLVGLFVGWGWKDNLWSTSFNRQFVNDYAASVNGEQNFSDLDSAVISGSPGLFSDKKGSSVTMPGCEMRSFHNYSLYYGAVIKLPYKYMPVVKLYTGSTRSHYQGPGGIITPGKDYNILQLRRSMYGCEIMVLNPLAVFYNQKPVPLYLQKTGISIYYEGCDFYESSLYFDDGERRTHISLKSFTGHSFLKKYKHEYAYGFKISFNII